MADIFDEVNEDLRQEKIEQFWKENGKFILICAFLTVAMTAATVYWRHWQMQVNTSKTSALIQATAAEGTEELEKFAAVAGKEHGALAKLIAAAKLVENDEPEKAAILYAEVAGADIDKIYRDYAMVQSLGRLLDGAEPNYADIETRLTAVVSEKGPWSALAREYLALSQAAQGKYALAAETIEMLVAASDTPDEMRARALMWRDLFSAKASLTTGAVDTGADKEGSAG